MGTEHIVLLPGRTDLVAPDRRWEVAKFLCVASAVAAATVGALALLRPHSPAPGLGSQAYATTAIPQTRIQPLPRNMRDAAAARHSAALHPTPTPLAASLAGVPDMGAPTTGPIHAPRHATKATMRQPALLHLLTFVGVPAVLAGVLTYLRTWRRAPAVAMAACAGEPAPRPMVRPSARYSMALRATPTDGDEGLAVQLKPLLPAKSPTGEFLDFILKDRPDLFEESVTAQIQLLCQQERQASSTVSPDVDKSEITLYERINEVKKMGQKQAVEDIMYFSILDQFRRLGVNPIQPGQLQYFSDFGPVNWESLTRGVHSDEALEVVRSHMRAVLGPVVDMPLTAMNAAIKISKFHAVQMFAASVLFGYFLRRADKRFALAKSLGMAPRVMSDAETVEMLEDLFNRADADEDSDSSSESTRGRTMTLKEYIESFTPEVMHETAKVVSMEATRVVHEYETALFGDLAELQKQLNDAINEGGPVLTPDEFLERMRDVVKEDKVDILVMSLSDQRRVVLEAVAFGAFLRDAESNIELLADEPILTPNQAKGRPPPGLLGSRDDGLGDDDDDRGGGGNVFMG